MVEVLILLELRNETGNSLFQGVGEFTFIFAWGGSHADESGSFETFKVLALDHCQEIELRHA